MRLEKKLQDLIICGLLKSFKIQNVDEEGNIDKKSNYRNTEQLTLEFPCGEILVIGTFCSGCAEDTGFVLAE